MIDLQELVEFAKEYSAVLDTLGQVQRLKPPKVSEGVMGLEEWFREFQQIWLTLSKLPDPERLTRFAEHLDEVLARLAGTEAPQPPVEEEALLPLELPEGDADNEMLKWDNTAKAWIIQDAPNADFKVLQRKADDSIGWDYVRAH